MASKTSNCGGGGDGSRGEKQKWAESKVYTRKSHNNKVSTKNIRQPPSSQTLTSEDGNNSSQPPQLTRFEIASDDSSSLNRRQQLCPPNNRDPPSMNGFSSRAENRITINLSSKLKQELRELRRKLTKELEQVRNLVKKLESKELQISGSYTQSQLSTNYTVDNGGGGGGGSKRDKFKAPLHRLSISAVEDSQGGLTDNAQKEKRTPKANQYYRKSEFVLGKEKLPPQDSNKKAKTNGGKKNGGSGEGNYGFGMDKNSGRVFKSCSDLLAKLMKHKHGWVFNTPVDVKGLGLRDYYVIIKNPMDLGTVKTRLNKNGYKSPKEFAEDVKLTFHNAMSYNRKGQDVHIMAEELLKIFEDKWVVIQAEFNRGSRFEGDHEAGLPKKIRKSDHFSAPEMKRTLDRSESTAVPSNSQLKPLDVVGSGRIPAQKKPKANDVNKREMTYEEKQKLSTNLQSLPVEKLDNIVQIIKNRNPSLCQHDDEIEVDIDSVDTETLWELDRFVTNFKKSLNKNKRKAETVIQPREESEQKVEETDPVPPIVEVEVPKETKTVPDADEKNVSSSLPVQEEKQGDPASRSSSSSSSSSDSGSSSSDSDSESSSASDSGH